MKTLLLTLLLACGYAFAAHAQVDTVSFKTSARCIMCKDRLEEKLLFEKGVQKAELNLDTKVLTIWYNRKRTEPAALKKAVNLIGYDADETTADAAAHAALPGCCQKSATEH